MTKRSETGFLEKLSPFVADLEVEISGSELSQLKGRVAEVARLPVGQSFIGSLAISATNEPVILAVTER